MSLPKNPNKNLQSREDRNNGLKMLVLVLGEYQGGSFAKDKFVNIFLVYISFSKPRNFLPLQFPNNRFFSVSEFYTVF